MNEGQQQVNEGQQQINEANNKKTTPINRDGFPKKNKNYLLFDNFKSFDCIVNRNLN